MNDSKFNVVFVDDEADLLELYRVNLSEEFTLHPFTNVEEALAHLGSNPVDALVLDYHIPGQNMKELFQELRERRFERPVLFLTGELSLEVKLHLLDLGVDDFLYKPLTALELGAHLKNRIRSHRLTSPDLRTFLNMQINLDDPLVKVDDGTVSLTPKEFEILRMMVTCPGSIIRKFEIMDRLWPDVRVEENNVDTHISNLRRKLKDFSGEIRTIKGIGYVLENPAGAVRSLQ